MLSKVRHALMSWNTTRPEWKRLLGSLYYKVVVGLFGWICQRHLTVKGNHLLRIWDWDPLVSVTIYLHPLFQRWLDSSSSLTACMGTTSTCHLLTEAADHGRSLQMSTDQQAQGC